MNFRRLSMKMLFSIIFSTIIIVEAGYNCGKGILTSQQRESIVQQHNEFRSQLIHGKFKNKDGKYMPKGKNMLKMKWSCKLEESAQTWANRRNYRNSLRHEREGISENVYDSHLRTYSESSIAFSDAAKVWWSELRREYTDNPSNKFTSNVSSKALHFTRMAWAKTYKIGCGYATYYHYYYEWVIHVVCHYSPSGNQLDEMIYEIGEPCKKDSDCYTKKCSKKSGLCKKKKFLIF